MPLYNPAFVAGGPIYPARFVKLSNTEDFTVLECDLGDKVIGVSQEGSFAPPGIAEGLGGSQTYLAANTKQTLKVFGLGDVCVVEAGLAITVGDHLKSDGNGKAVPATAGDYVGGVALQSVAVGNKCLIQVAPQKL